MLWYTKQEGSRKQLVCISNDRSRLRHPAVKPSVAASDLGPTRSVRCKSAQPVTYARKSIAVGRAGVWGIPGTVTLYFDVKHVSFK